MTGFNFNTLNTAVLNMMTEAGLDPVTQYEEVPRISTGSLLVDWSFSGGFPRGRYTLLYGCSLRSLQRSVT